MIILFFVCAKSYYASENLECSVSVIYTTFDYSYYFLVIFQIARSSPHLQSFKCSNWAGYWCPTKV